MRRALAVAAAILGVLALFAGGAPERSADGSSAVPPDRSADGSSAVPPPARRQVSAPASRWRYSRRAAGATLAPVELAEWIRDRKPNLRVIDVRSEAEFDEYHLPRAERFTSSTTFAPDDTVVLVAGGSVQARNVYILRGGIQAWIDEVMNPTITADAPQSARAAYERASVVSRYFGGVPRVVDKLPAKRANAATVRRRGC